MRNPLIARAMTSCWICSVLEIYCSVLDADRHRDLRQEVFEYALTAGRGLDGS